MADAGAAALQAYFSGLTESGANVQIPLQNQPLFNLQSNGQTYNPQMVQPPNPSNGRIPNFANSNPPPLPPAVQMQLAQYTPAQRQAFFQQYQLAQRNATGQMPPPNPNVAPAFLNPANVSVQANAFNPNNAPNNFNPQAMQQLMSYMAQQQQQPFNVPQPPGQFSNMVNPALIHPQQPNQMSPQILQQLQQASVNPLQSRDALTAKNLQNLLAEGKMTQEQLNNFVRLNMQRRGANAGPLVNLPGGVPGGSQLPPNGNLAQSSTPVPQQPIMQQPIPFSQSAVPPLQKPLATPQPPVQAIPLAAQVRFFSDLSFIPSLLKIVYIGSTSVISAYRFPRPL